MKKIMFGVFVVSIFLFTQSAFAATATAIVSGTSVEGPAVTGEVTLVEMNDGLDIMVTLYGVPPGKHGFHIHENGSCAEAGSAAGGHYNPDGVVHGLVVKDGNEHAHAGDFGNIEIDGQGNGSLHFFIPKLTLSGEKYNVSGRAVILHEKEDDFGQPTGNAGGRIGCGLIVIDEPEAEMMMDEAESLGE